MFDKVILLNSNDLVNDNPKLINKDNVSYGEVGINYLTNNERISLRNDKDEIAEFIPKYEYDKYFSYVKPEIFLQEEEPNGKDGDIWIF